MRVQTYLLRLQANRYPLAAIALLVLTLISIIFTYSPATYAEKVMAAITVYKSPSCGCCGAWVDHIEQSGFNTTIKHYQDLNAVKKQLDVPPSYQACHTAAYGEYVFEGHIPSKFIQQFLNNPPTNASGLAVPAMPLGSPGMEVGQRFTPYTIYQLNGDDEPTVFVTVSRMEEQY